MTNTVTQSQQIDLDSLGLTVDDWVSIAKTATAEAIKSVLDDNEVGG